ncbi:hypothetical protein PMAYCL1PPCAC_29195 [Pristionchus mayeri]|uniref:Uncharacterized protein n=1 Tax=Pristionchus mayeri TaxID=1317129 RepID=A0AAN5DAD0_9BILA|nr:hypothetical protein PMAYCL1PPCAC_29195 [Pristionchus mayeri]
MLIREPFRQNFYDVVRKKHVVLIVANDIDALCAASILMHLFSCDDRSSSIIYVASWNSLERALHDHIQQEHNFVLINCCGSREATDLPLHPNSAVFIVDSRRPIDVDNIYHNEQIKVVAMGKEIDEDLKIPAFESVYIEESEDDDDDDEEEDVENEEMDENGENRKMNRMEKLESRVLKKKEREMWAKKRGDLLWEYYENSWISTASSVVMLNVAAELSRATAELVWITSISLSCQLADGDISINGYTHACLDHMKPYLAKFAPRGEARADDLLRIKFERELPLALYHHWSLFQAMKVDPLFACKTRNWSQRGEHEMKHLLANIGLTLNECRQKFTSMTLERRKEVIQLLEKAMDAKFASFFVHRGFSERVSACDVGRALSTWLGSARLDCSSLSPVDPSSPFSYQIPPSLADRFEECRGILTSFITSSTDMPLLHKMMSLSRSELEGIWQNVASAINQGEVLPNGRFYLFSTNKPRDSSLLSRPSLFAFTRFLASAYNRKGPGRNGRPLIVSFPSEEEGWLIVLGVMPLATDYGDNHLKSFIGRSFEQISKQPRINIRRDFFDPNIILLKAEDRGRFFDQLQIHLESNIS